MVLKVHHLRILRLVTIHAPSVRQVSLDIRRRNRQQLGLVAHDPNGLHACIGELASFPNLVVKGALTHDHMLQNMTMDHPHAWLRNSQPPGPPSGRRSRRRIRAIPI
jgi:hypothetical protein